MQHIENDMDDLFQRASENYPLQAGKGNWESIARQIAAKSNSATAVAPKSNKRNKKFIAFWLLFVLLLCGWFIYQYNFADKLFIAKRGDLAKKLDDSASDTTNKNNNSIVSTSETFNNKPEKKKLYGYGKRIFTTAVIASAKSTAGISSDFFYSKNFTKSSGNKKPETILLTGNTKINNNYLPPSQEFMKETGKSYSENLKNYNGAILEKEKKAGSELPVNAKEDNISVKAERSKNAKQITIKKRSVYFGLVAGVDFSKVEAMPFNNQGFVGGLFAGYKIRKHFSLETGIIWNNKNYNSNGRSFNMDKVRSTMPSGMIINTIESKSSLIEIPVKVKYDFVIERNSALFICGGISSYIMTKEKNNYQVSMNGSQEKIIGTYNKNNYGLPAIADISIGFEHPVSSYLKIRIEPFLKIPLRGIGIGNLPITSAGLQIGIISQLK